VCIERLFDHSIFFGRHLAIAIANKLGAEVTAFSSSKDKEAESKTLGAHHFVWTSV
jgi:D-arabinose 1-dehydrogenase-like Zn-dependent alcohol dehydrogenase